MKAIKFPIRNPMILISTVNFPVVPNVWYAAQNKSTQHIEILTKIFKKYKNSSVWNSSAIW